MDACRVGAISLTPFGPKGPANPRPSPRRLSWIWYGILLSAGTLVFAFENSTCLAEPGLRQTQLWKQCSAHANILEDIIEIIKDIVNPPPPPPEEPPSGGGW